MDVSLDLISPWCELPVLAARLRRSSLEVSKFPQPFEFPASMKRPQLAGGFGMPSEAFQKRHWVSPTSLVTELIQILIPFGSFRLDPCPWTWFHNLSIGLTVLHLMVKTSTHVKKNMVFCQKTPWFSAAVGHCWSSVSCLFRLILQVLPGEAGPQAVLFRKFLAPLVIGKSSAGHIFSCLRRCWKCGLYQPQKEK